MDVTTDWFREGNVVEAIARVSRAGRMDHPGQGRHALKRARRGYPGGPRRAGPFWSRPRAIPSKTYRDPRRAGEVKPTNPTNQAQQWYSHALLKVMRLQTKDPRRAGRAGLSGLPALPRAVRGDAWRSRQARRCDANGPRGRRRWSVECMAKLQVQIHD